MSAVIYAVTEPKHRVLSLWISNSLFFVLLAGIAIFGLVGTSAPTINVIANKAIDLSNEAGVSSVQEPSGLSFSSGSANTVDCYTMVGRSIWLFFHHNSVDYGWAPLADFHYENGFSEGLPAHC